VINPPALWFKNMIPKMSNLQTINVYQAPCARTVTNLKQIRLERVKLDGINQEPPMTSITYLDLRRIPVDCSVQLLVKCPNLVEFSCLHHTPQRTSCANVLPPTLMLDQLTAFSWSTPRRSSPWLHDELFEHLHVPALQQFYLDNYQKLHPHLHSSLDSVNQRRNSDFVAWVIR
jgi:hypothetical protein